MTDHKTAAERILAGPASRHPESPDSLAELTAANAHASLAVADVIAAATMTVGEALSTLAPMLLGHIDPLSLIPTKTAPPSDPDTPPLDKALMDVHWERLKQLSQGWSFEHDESHGLGHLKRLMFDYRVGRRRPARTWSSWRRSLLPGSR